MQERFDRAQQRHAAQMQQHAEKQASALEAAAAQRQRAAHDAAAAHAAIVSNLEGQLWQAQSAAQVRCKIGCPYVRRLGSCIKLEFSVVSSGRGSSLSIQQNLGCISHAAC